MARVKAGVEMPIIPEDFEVLDDEDLLSTMIRRILGEPIETPQDGDLYAVEWAVMESLCDRRS